MEHELEHSPAAPAVDAEGRRRQNADKTDRRKAVKNFFDMKLRKTVQREKEKGGD